MDRAAGERKRAALGAHDVLQEVYRCSGSAGAVISSKPERFMLPKTGSQAQSLLVAQAEASL